MDGKEKMEYKVKIFYNVYVVKECLILSRLVIFFKIKCSLMQKAHTSGIVCIKIDLILIKIYKVD